MKKRARIVASALAGALVVVSVFAFGGPVLAFAPPPISPGQLAQYAPGVPSSVLGAAETSPLEGAESAGLATQGVSDFEVPTASPSGLSKLAGGSTVALLGASIAWGERANISTGVNSLYGVDADSAICAPGNNAGAWEGIIQSVTGLTCASDTALGPDYEANGDRSDITTGGPSCITDPTGLGSACVSMTGIDQLTPHVDCFDLTGDYTADKVGVRIMYGDSIQIAVAGVMTTATAFPDGDDCAGSNVAIYNSYIPIQSYCINWDQGSDCVGSSIAVSTDRSDPVRTLKCVVATSTGGVYSASSAGFLESAGVLPNPVCPSTPPGGVTTDTKVYEVTPGQPDELLSDLPATTPYGNWAAAHPNCLTGACALDVETLSTPRQSCNENPLATFNGVSCADWFTDPDRADDFVCVYDGADQDISECNVISQFYKPSALASGDLYADPLTGLLPSGQTSVTPGTIPSGTPVADPDSSRACFPNGWALNPIDWVLTPISCAMQYLFVPRESVIKKDGSRFKKALGGSAVGSIIGVLAGMGTFPITGSGCSGIPWRFHIFDIDQTYYLLAACPGDPLQPTATVVKTILTAVVITIGVLTSARYIANIFGYIGFGGQVDADRREAYREEAKNARRRR